MLARREIEMILMLAIQGSLFSPVGQGRRREELHERRAQAEIGPMNEGRALSLLEGYRMLLRRANDWRENAEIGRCATWYLSTIMEVTIADMRELGATAG